MGSVPLACLVILGSGLLGGVLPFVVRRSDRLLHLFIAFATGVFLGTVFLDLLPEVARLATSATEARQGGLWLWVLLGFLLLYLLEVGLLARAGGDDEHQQHKVVGYASWVGLCAHSFFTGLGIASVAEPELRSSMVGAIVGHKAAESFSLASVFLLAGFRRRAGAGLVVVHSFVTPAGLLLGSWWLATRGGGGAVLTALAAGTFLFVALCDLLPEVFHHRVDGLWKVLALGAGLAANGLHLGS